MKRTLLIALIMACAQTLHAQDGLKAALTRLSNPALKTLIQEVLTPQPAIEALSPDDYAALEAEFFALMNWTQDEIDWFRNVYTPLYGNPEEYVLSQLELLKALNQSP